MIRSILLFAFFAVVYYGLKSLVRSAMRGYRRDVDHAPHTQILGEDMVLDPECRTYVPKGRAVTRRIGGVQCSFCSEACAKSYEEKSRT